jgi:hypothetical protein
MTDRRNVGGSAILALALLLAPHMTDARAVNMVESKPQAETTIDGDHAEYVVRFDGPVNHYASRLEIVQDGRVVRTLRPLQNAAVDVLFAAAPVPAPGSTTFAGRRSPATASRAVAKSRSPYGNRVGL